METSQVGPPGHPGDDGSVFAHAGLSHYLADKAGADDALADEPLADFQFPSGM